MMMPLEPDLHRAPRAVLDHPALPIPPPDDRHASPPPRKVVDHPPRLQPRPLRRTLPLVGPRTLRASAVDRSSHAMATLRADLARAHRSAEDRPRPLIRIASEPGPRRAPVDREELPSDSRAR